MTSEAQQFLDKAFRCWEEACQIAAIGLYENASRSAYLAAFHAAQALIFERARRVVKTHSGVRAEFARFAKEDPRIDRSYVAFLARGFDLKSIADYAIDPNLTVSAEESVAAIDKASQVVACIKQILDNHSDADSG